MRGFRGGEKGTGPYLKFSKCHVKKSFFTLTLSEIYFWPHLENMKFGPYLGKTPGSALG